MTDVKFEVSPGFSSIFSKIPSQIASEHGGINEKNLEKTMCLLERLFLPLVGAEYIFAGPSGYFIRPDSMNTVRGGFTDTVTVLLRMLGSRQQFEFRWDETSATSICMFPAVYSHAGKDGVPLELLACSLL
jgi:hypothetical protein